MIITGYYTCSVLKDDYNGLLQMFGIERR